MNDLDIRLAMLNPATRQRIQELALSPGYIQLMVHVSLGSDTASKIAKATETTIPSISNRLNRLRQKGYLTRKEVAQSSGGYEYQYSNIFEPAQQQGGE